MGPQMAFLSPIRHNRCVSRRPSCPFRSCLPSVVGFGSQSFSAPSDPSHPSPGITTDLLIYSIIIPVVPFQLERLKYHSVSALTGWLLCAYVRPSSSFPQTRSHHPSQSVGLVICTSHFFPSLPILISRQPQYLSQSSQKIVPPGVPPSSLASSLS